MTFGSLLGANVGAAASDGLMRAKVISHADFGWLSAFVVGTVLGAGVGAPFSTTDDAHPILAGLGLGPVVGMVAGRCCCRR